VTHTDSIKVIDGRGLEPPEPFLLVTDALGVCPPGGAVLLLQAREPPPLPGAGSRRLLIRCLIHS
jgi:hypothetical protein